MDPYFPEFSFGVKCLLRSERWNSRPLTGLKLKRGAVKRNGKGCVINACVFPEFHFIKDTTRHNRKEQGFVTANEVVSNCFNSAIPIPRPVLRPSPTNVLIAHILFTSKNSRKRLPFLDSVPAPLRWPRCERYQP